LPDGIQHFLKAAAGAARAQVFPAQFFKQVFFNVYDSKAAFDVGL
jgi:hypothetical protein